MKSPKRPVTWEPDTAFPVELDTDWLTSVLLDPICEAEAEPKPELAWGPASVVALFVAVAGPDTAVSFVELFEFWTTVSASATPGTSRAAPSVIVAIVLRLIFDLPVLPS